MNPRFISWLRGKKLFCAKKTFFYGIKILIGFKKKYFKKFSLLNSNNYKESIYEKLITA